MSGVSIKAIAAVVRVSPSPESANMAKTAVLPRFAQAPACEAPTSRGDRRRALRATGRLRLARVAALRYPRRRSRWKA